MHDIVDFEAIRDRILFELKLGDRLQDIKQPKKRSINSLQNLNSWLKALFDRLKPKFLLNG
ncbi:hypothetical protein [Nostoc sp. FACHB-888]|uniref:hypothetical protein n=1 Tax=Nostoc sp. FACHB-888 TaxID=2692842 RepID=UPI0016857112|nr:hypothetical protein [Nostoc sp. FACHB-888]MBD2248488.1 hypothetical protein [Nostoc sp. FACHB-888]